MSLQNRLNEASIKPIVIEGGKVGLYKTSGRYTEGGHALIEDEFGIRDAYIAQNPHSEEQNNLVVWIDCPTASNIFFDKKAQKWATFAAEVV